MKNGNQWISRSDWYEKLSRETRIRWYVETGFDRIPPSAELMTLVQMEIGAGRPGAPTALPPLAAGSREPAEG